MRPGYGARSPAKPGYLAFAIGLHAIFDMPAALYQFGYVKQLFPVELWLAVCALYALRSARTSASGSGPVSVPRLATA